MSEIYVTGHRNPDTDAIVAAIAYANLRHALGDREYVAARIGAVNDETQRLLRAAGKSPLYPRLKRDAVILYGIGKKLPILTVQESLTKYGLTLLGGLKNGID